VYKRQVFYYAFNHQEAERSFRMAARLDPESPMPWWGAALALGPNINAIMDREAGERAWDALQRAIELKDNGSALERSLIDALSARYAPDVPDDRAHLDLAFADAMARVAARFPDHNDVLTLAAEAQMTTTPWDYWAPDGSPRPAIERALEHINRAIALAPRNPGAHHLLIHAVEAGPTPELGIPSADLLTDLTPAAGHLVHMPSHIYLRLGMYNAASEANERAIEADEHYIDQCGAQGFYPLLYYPHNYHFLWYAMTLEGRGDEAIALAHKISDNTTDEYVQRDQLLPVAIQTLVRFSEWNAVLEQPEPSASDVFNHTIWRYATGLAHAAKGDPRAAQEQLDAMRARVGSPEAEALEAPFFYGHSQLRIALSELEAAVAWAGGDQDLAIRYLEEAVRLNDALPYMEPPYWHYPVRQALGHALLDAGRAHEAAAVFRADLVDAPANGWSLSGLSRAYSAIGMEFAAREVERELASAWIRGDRAPDAWTIGE